MTMLSRFEIVAQEDPQLPLRMLNHFAMRGLMPCRTCIDRAGGSLVIQIDQPDLAEQDALIIAEKMRGTVLVESVRLTRGCAGPIPSRGAIDDLSAQ